MFNVSVVVIILLCYLILVKIFPFGWTEVHHKSAYLFLKLNFPDIKVETLLHM